MTLPTHTVIFTGILSLLLFSCSQRYPYNRIESNGIVIYTDGAASIHSYFQSHRLMVSQVIRYQPELKKYQLFYPSTNDGPSPKYSHLVEIHVAKGVPLTVNEVMASERLAILHATNDQFVWKLVGTAPMTSANGLFDWFSDKHFLRRSLEHRSQRHDCCMKK